MGQVLSDPGVADDSFPDRVEETKPICGGSGEGCQAEEAGRERPSLDRAERGAEVAPVGAK